MFKPVPTTIRGVTYPSRGAAARAMGVTNGAIEQAIKRGTLDRVGLSKKGRPGDAIELMGIRWPSLAKASKDLGMNRGYLQELRKNPSPRRLKNLAWRVRQYAERNGIEIKEDHNGDVERTAQTTEGAEQGREARSNRAGGKAGGDAQGRGVCSGHLR